jgi:hypothetical protein
VYSFYLKDGSVNEYLCVALCCTGFLFVLPVYISLWKGFVVFAGLNFILFLVLGTLFLPILIAFAQSVKSAVLYLHYLPWFLFCIVFLLVYLPSYSFARLWDTSWGNRAGGVDAAIEDKDEIVMKRRTFYFFSGLVASNALLCTALIKFYHLGYIFVEILMGVIFFPLLLQFITAIYFMFFVIPSRSIFSQRSTTKMEIMLQQIVNLLKKNNNEENELHDNKCLLMLNNRKNNNEENSNFDDQNNLLLQDVEKGKKNKKITTNNNINNPEFFNPILSAT